MNEDLLLKANERLERAREDIEFLMSRLDLSLIHNFKLAMALTNLLKAQDLIQRAARP
jgi:hypothetical protein